MKGRPAQEASGPSTLAEPFLRHRARQMIGSSVNEASDMSKFCDAFLHALTPAPKGPFSGFVHARLLHGCIQTRMGISTAAGKIQESVFEELTPRMAVSSSSCRSADGRGEWALAPP
jgi:hypothetical protein